MKRPDRWFPHPWLTVTLVIGWLLLMNSLSFGNLLMGLVLGVIIPWLTHVFWPASRYRLRVGKLVLFVARVVTDIVLVSLRDFQDEKGDIILKYNSEEAKNLKTYLFLAIILLV